MNKRNKKVLIAFSTGLVVLAAISLYAVVRNGSNILNRHNMYTGQLESADITGMATDAPGIYKVRTDAGVVTVHLDAGESNCDRMAIVVPNVKVGDNVSVSGDHQVDGSILVCAQGTYIKMAH